jgi:hypothetical protein
MANFHKIQKRCSTHNSNYGLLVTGLLLTLLALHSNSTLAAKLYKWVDADGNISYQSSPPPVDAKILTEKTLDVTRTRPGNSKNQNPVTVYTVNDCASCDELIERLTKMDITVIQKSLNDRDVQKEVVDATSQLIAPTLLVGEQYITDTSKSNVESKLETAGYTVPSADETPNSAPASSDGERGGAADPFEVQPSQPSTL